jgi:hypothetical protein
MDLKKLCATAALALAVAGFGLSGVAGATGGFSSHSLAGTYSFRAQATTESEVGDDGWMNLAGLLTFNGTGTITAVDIQVTGGDTGGPFDQFDCGAITSLESGSYSVNSDGTGSFSLEFSDTDSCLPNDSMTFTFALSRSAGGIAQINSAAFGDDNTLLDCSFAASNELFQTTLGPGDCLTEFVADGEMVHQ